MYICVHIHPALDSSQSEDRQLGPTDGMTLDRSEHFPSGSHVNKGAKAPPTLKITQKVPFYFEVKCPVSL